MLYRLSALCRCRPAAALSAVLALSVSSAVRTTAQQPVRSGPAENRPPAAHLPAPKSAAFPLNAAQRLRVTTQYGRMPLQFEQNLGQAPKSIRFLSLHGSYEVAVTPDRLVLNLKGHGVGGADGLVSMRLLGANPAPAVTGEQELPGKVNYFLGNRAEKWHTGISTFSQVRLKEVYPGVDLVYYGSQKQLEYDFVLKPGVDAAQVRLGFTGARNLHLQANGDLLLRAKAGEMRWKRPEVYQMIGGKRRVVAAHYKIRSERRGASRIGFEVAQYDRSRPLIIDPALVVRYYDTLTSTAGQINTTGSNSLVADAAGNVYGAASVSSASATFTQAAKVGGAATTTNQNFSKFPGSANAASYLLVMKLNSTGSIVYEDIIGGSSPDGTKPFVDAANGIAIDAAGQVYLVGSCQSPDMPMAGSSYQTFIGFSGNTNVSGSNHNHLVKNAYIAKLNAAGSALLYGSYFGGRSTEQGDSIAVDASGSVIYIGGFTPTCNNFPATGGRVDNFPAVNNNLNGNGFQTAYGGSFEDGYVARLDDAGGGTAYNQLKYVTLIGGAGPDSVKHVAIDPNSSNIVYAVGTAGTGNEPSNNIFGSNGANGFQTSPGLGSSGFLVKIDTLLTGAGSMKYGTYIGGTTNATGDSTVSNSNAYSAAVVGSGVVYVGGDTNTNNFPVTANGFQTSHGGAAIDDPTGFLVKVDTTLTGAGSELYGTYLGGGGFTEVYAVAYAGTSVYVTGLTQSTAANGAFPTSANAVFTANQGGPNGDDAFVVSFTETNAATHAHTLNFSTYLGTSLDDSGAGIGVDSIGNVYIEGDLGLNGAVQPGIWFAKIALNHPPVANSQSVTVLKNSANNPIALTGSDADIPADTLTYTVLTSPSHGTLGGSGVSRTYTPTAGYNGADSFTFKINDGHDDSNTATVTISVLSPPTANSQTVSVAHNTAKAITLTGSDPNMPALTLTYNVTVSPAHGSLSGTAPNLTCTPSAGYSGADSFLFTVTNSAGLTSSAATVTLNVAAGAPTANAQTVSVSHNTAKAMTLTGSDPNIPALTLTYSVISSSSHGALSGTAPNLTYTPNAGYSGADSFQFTVTNSAGLTSSAATVTLNVAATAPIANAQTVSVAHNTATAVTLTGSDPNVPALTPLTFSVTVSPTHGTLSGAAPNLTYTPNAGYTGSDSFLFNVTNTAGITSSAATVTLNVAAGAPTANGQSVSTNQDSAVGITLTGTDSNVPALTLTYSVTSSPSHGVLTGTAPNLTYTPSAGYTGPDSFLFTVTNTAGLTSSAATVSIGVAQTVVDVTGQVSVSRGPLLYRRSTGTYIQVLTLTNTGDTAIAGPISSILTGLTNATLANASGTTSAVLSAGRPYLDAGVGSLAAGASVSVTLSFTKNGAGSITYTVQVVAGPGSR